MVFHREGRIHPHTSSLHMQMTFKQDCNDPREVAVGSHTDKSLKSFKSFTDG